MADDMSLFDGLLTINNETSVTFCTTWPPQVNAPGVWGIRINSSSIRRLPSAFPLFEFQIIFFFFIYQSIHFVLKRFGFQSFVSQILAGTMIGTSIKRNYYPLRVLDNFKKDLFFLGTQNVLSTSTSVFGYAFFLFLIAVKMDVMMIKNSGRKSWLIGFSSLLVPLCLGVVSSVSITHLNSKEGAALVSDIPVIGVTHSMTSFAVVASLLDQLEILNSGLGRLGLSSALVAEMASVTVQAIGGFVLTNSKDSYMLFVKVGGTFGFLIVVVFAFRPAMFWIIKRTPKGKPVRNEYICGIVVLVLASSLISHLLGLTLFLGPFVLGLAVPDGPPLGSTIGSKLDGIVSTVFVPLFVMVSASKGDLSNLMENGKAMFLYLFVILLTLLSKIAVTSGISMYCKVPFSDALALGLIMSCKGVVDIAVYAFTYDRKLLHDQTFALLVVDLLLVSSITPFLVKYLYDPSRKYAGYQKRNIMILQPKDDLRILACIHSEYNIPSLINLIKASCPTGKSPVSIFALDLIELIGRSSPVFISHQLHGEEDFAHWTISNNLIHSLGKYARDNLGLVSVEVFTAISPSKLMHEDICTLALDKTTSLIVLPFHRKWSVDGVVDSDTIRSVNRSVLERAPCSVGIYVDRSHSTHSFIDGRSSSSRKSPLRVAMIFLGGSDDREALSFAKRMTTDPGNTQLTVLRLVSQYASISEWEDVLDSEALKRAKHDNPGNDEFTYIEEMAEEGTKTARIVKLVTKEHDLIIVGRRKGIESPQTSGLVEWSEFPELGIIGDLLASSDFDGKASILVMQQQLMT